jgi:hypothetical protein
MQEAEIEESQSRPAPGKNARPYCKISTTKRGCGSNGREAALQAQDLDFKTRKKDDYKNIIFSLFSSVRQRLSVGWSCL